MEEKRLTEDEEEAQKLSRRQVLKKGIRWGGGVIGVSAFYSILIEPTWFELVKSTVTIKDLPSAFEGFKVGVMSDFHFGNRLSPKEAQDCCQMLMAEKPDLILMPGDFLQKGLEWALPDLRHGLPGLTAPLGVFAVLGNHDHMGPVHKIVETLDRLGCRTLMNEHLPLSKDGERIWLCGTDDLRRGVYRPDLALAGLPKDEPRIMLQHTPDASEELSPDWRVDLAISGHMHGGQAYPFAWIPGVTPSRYGTKFARGLVQGKGHRVYVTRGIGGQGPGRPRLFSRPEVSLITLKSES